MAPGRHRRQQGRARKRPRPPTAIEMTDCRTRLTIAPHRPGYPCSTAGRYTRSRSPAAHLTTPTSSSIWATGPCGVGPTADGRHRADRRAAGGGARRRRLRRPTVGAPKTPTWARHSSRPGARSPRCGRRAVSALIRPTPRRGSTCPRSRVRVGVASRAAVPQARGTPPTGPPKK